MELKQGQVNKFIEIHKGNGGLEGYSEEQQMQVANGVANYYLSLFKIQQNIRKRRGNSGQIPGG